MSADKRSVDMQRLKSYSEEFHKITRKTTLLEFLTCNYIKMRFREKCFSVNLSKFYRTIFSKKDCEWFLLDAFVEALSYFIVALCFLVFFCINLNVFVVNIF